MTEHTPTPWYVVRMRGWDGPVIGRRSQYEADLVSGDVPLAKMIDKASHWENSFPVEANAAFIVKAVNNHERLVEALHGLIIGATCEVNEKGAGGFMLARLSDAKKVLGEVAPDRLTALVGGEKL